MIYSQLMIYQFSAFLSFYPSFRFLYVVLSAIFCCGSDERIALLGAIQSLFEGSMYTFVFLWTPALSPNDEEIPHGFIFSTFMLASMLGSSFASRLMARNSPKVEIYMQIVFVISSASLLLPIMTNVCASSLSPLFTSQLWLLSNFPNFLTVLGSPLEG